MTHPQSTPLIPLDQIEPGYRYRIDYGDLDQLCFDIKKNGLITPIAIGHSDRVTGVMPKGETTTLPYVLLAGGRRFTALKKLGWTHAPVRIYDQHLSELEFRSIELAENLCRKDMTFVEDVALKRKINDLQMAIHGQKFSKAPDAAGWSQADTARLINESPATISQDIKLAEAIEKFPELKLDECKNKSEALKRLKNVGNIITRSIGAENYTNKMFNSDLFNKLSTAYIIKDCLEVFSKIPNNSLNFIEIDPPYAIDLTNVKKDNDCMGYNEIDKSVYASFMSKVFQESYRTLREDGWLVCWFAADPWFQEIAELMRLAGFKMNLIPGIWVKPNGQTAQPETYMGNAYEMFFYARKGNGKLCKPGRNNIFTFSPVPPASKYHPTQRPIELMNEIFSTFTKPGDNAYIPFLGSGVSLLSAHQSKVQAYGTDLTQEFKDGYILQLKTLLETSA